MATPHPKTTLTLDNGTTVEAQAPVIVSASRSTDIPAFYADWFFERLKRGYSAWTNPFNGHTSYVAYDKTRFIVFWSKTPRPLLGHLDYLAAHNIGCYVQYTLNDYGHEGLEKGVPPLDQRIETFRLLADALGPSRVIWRFDPMIITDRISIDTLLDKVTHIGDRLKGHTEKLVFSYADIASYRKVRANLLKNDINYTEWDEDSMREFASQLASINRERRWGLRLATCGERIDLQQFGIEHNRCVDEDLIIRLAYRDSRLMDYLNVDIRLTPQAAPSIFEEYTAPAPLPDGAISLTDDTYALKRRNNLDKGQRQYCGCTISKDIGQYSTCPHLCEYCYANSSKETALANWHLHTSRPLADSIIG